MESVIGAKLRLEVLGGVPLPMVAVMAAAELVLIFLGGRKGCQRRNLCGVRSFLDACKGAMTASKMLL